MTEIRNFCILAHIDHGKSTLADRFLEITGTIEKRKMREQFLDMHPLEREKGITIKMQPVRMLFKTRIDADQNADSRGTLLYEDLTYRIRGAIFNVYNALGSSFKEAIYQNALVEELKKQGVAFEREKAIDVLYGGKKVGIYRPDFILEDKILLELKALPFLGKLEKKQVWHYLKGSVYRLAFLVNFGAKELEIERIIYDDVRDNLRIDPRESAYILNLIDTPGHVDFTYEVSRALAAVEGAILLVDATQGVQAQTLANLYLAQKEGLTIIPVINKIDLASAEVQKAEKELAMLLNVTNKDIFRISAKEGTGVEDLLKAVIARVPPPKTRFKDLTIETLKDAPLRALIFDSKFDPYQGVIVHVRVFSGKITKGERIRFIATQEDAEAGEVGFFLPDRAARNEINAGEIGYIATGIKEPEKVRVGDTITHTDEFKRLNVAVFKLLALPGYHEPIPMVFASIFPENQDHYELLREALKKLQLEDAALTFEPEESSALGRGYRAGFLGMLHMEIISERLRREYDLPLIFSNPSVVFEVKKKNGEELFVYSAIKMPPEHEIEYLKEPWVVVEIVTPSSVLGGLSTLIHEHGGQIVSSVSLAGDRMTFKVEAPLREIIIDFYDKLKSVSRGFASMSYALTDFRPADLVKLDILVAGEKVLSFGEIIPREKAYAIGRMRCAKLKDLLPRQLFQVAIQAEVGGKIIARESISAMSKDVTKHMYGGDRTRKMKLWKKQQRGKQRLKESAHVEIPPEVFLKMLKK